MEKFLCTIEFRYTGIPKGNWDTEHKSKTITIGVFDSFEEAAIKGNVALEVFEKYFKLNPHYNIKERFSLKGGCFGYPKDLITNLAYLQTSFGFYAKIKKLIYADVEQTILEVLQSIETYNTYKAKENENNY